MKIVADNLSKRYIRNFIIRDFNQTFSNENVYGIKGKNGSGKSTLVKLLSGFMEPSKGTIAYSQNGKEIPEDQIYRHISIAAPYMEMDMELTPKELFDHLKIFKQFQCNNVEELLRLSKLEGNENKQLSYFSSGMYQRFANILALTVDSDVVFLDEPSSYLDEKSKDWLYNILKDLKKNRLIIISSNDASDFRTVDTIIDLDTLA